MTLDALIILAGILVATLPFLGFPNAWDTALFFLLGVFTIGLGIAVRRHIGFAPRKNGSAFTENTPNSEGTHDAQ